jgi:Cys-rich protein (TIGR01571 family)
MAAAAEQSKGNIKNVKYIPVTEVTPIISQVIVINEDVSPIIPIHPTRNNWHFGLFERCFQFGGDCFMAWWCMCIPLGQISSKLKQVGNPYCIDYTAILWISLLLMILDSIFSAKSKVNTGYFNFFLFVITYQLRGVVRRQFNIGGGCLEDMFLSLFCPPCVITQMVGQLWAEPAVVPGCDVTENPAFIL